MIALRFSTHRLLNLPRSSTRVGFHRIMRGAAMPVLRVGGFTKMAKLGGSIATIGGFIALRGLSGNLNTAHAEAATVAQAKAKTVVVKPQISKPINEYEKPGMLRRIGSAVADVIVIMGFKIFTLLKVPSWACDLAGLAYFQIAYCLYGQTFGQFLTDQKILRRDGTLLSVGQAFGRGCLSFVLFGVEMVYWPFGDGDLLTDKIMGTTIIIVDDGDQ